MFTGFTKETGEFFWELSFNNERPWFLANKEQFEQVVNAPFKALAHDLYEEMTRRVPDGEFSVHLSRIYRDARRLISSYRSCASALKGALTTRSNSSLCARNQGRSLLKLSSQKNSPVCFVKPVNMARLLFCFLRSFYHREALFANSVQALLFVI